MDISINTDTTPFLQLGIVAIALYRAPVGAFPNGASAASINLVDALIYATGRQESGHGLVDTLLPSKLPVILYMDNLQFYRC